MNLFNVYSLYNIEPIKARGCKLWDSEGNEYIDFYGGHAVISIGHTHPHYVKLVSEQLQKIGFYSNSVVNSLQNSVAGKLGRLSEYEDYSFFFCNSGAEANENAFKLASFANKRDKIIALSKAFHGRTSGAVAATDNSSIISPYNALHHVEFVPFNDLYTIRKVLSKGDVSAVIIEGIQGVGGIHVPDTDFLVGLQEACKKNDTFLIVDEVQSGYGRSGRFFAHQYSGIHPDLITVAKGMGNGFPVAGVLIAPSFKSSIGLLGTTFGGNHLACAAAQSVLDVIEDEHLINNAVITGEYLKNRAQEVKGISEIRGLGLMVGLEFEVEASGIRKQLLFNHHIFTGYSGKHTIRLLPPLCISEAEIDHLVDSLKTTTDNIR